MEFYDTYAFIKIIQKGNTKLSPEVATLTTNLAEVYYWLLLRYNQKTADYFNKKILHITKEVPADIIPKAMQFKYENKKKKISYIDALGYTYARKHNIPFVTGDKEFKGIKGVKVIR